MLLPSTREHGNRSMPQLAKGTLSDFEALGIEGLTEEQMYCSICFAPTVLLRPRGGLYHNSYSAEPVTDARCCGHCFETIVEPAKENGNTVELPRKLTIGQSAQLEKSLRSRWIPERYKLRV